MNIDDVTIETELNTSIPEHQALLSFNTDKQAEEFYYWWEKYGADLFVMYYNKFFSK